MKRLLGLVFLWIAMTTALAETPAASIHRWGDYTYIFLDDGGIQIACWDGAEASLNVPGMIDGYAVESISECAFADCPGLRAVSLPESIVEIGDCAFINCPRLQTVCLNEGLKYLGSAVFQDCEGLTAIQLPASLESVGVNPFSGCENLCFIDIAPGNEQFYTAGGALFERGQGALVCYPSGLSTGHYEVPEGTLRIGEKAFYRDLFLEGISLPSSITFIAPDAFEGCQALKAMVLPFATLEIGEHSLATDNPALAVK